MGTRERIIQILEDERGVLPEVLADEILETLPTEFAGALVADTALTAEQEIRRDALQEANALMIAAIPEFVEPVAPDAAVEAVLVIADAYAKYITTG